MRVTAKAPSAAPQALLALAFCLALSVHVHGQGSSSPPPSGISSSTPSFDVKPTCSTGKAGTLSVNGRGEAQATADQAEVSLYISITNVTAEGAKNVAATFANKVIGAVRQVNGVSPENVTTTSVSVSPETTYNPSDGTSTTIGYTYTNYLSVSLDNVTGDLLSEVLDTAVTNGGNNLTISSVSFSLSPALSYNRTIDARVQAASDAKTTAQQYAQGLGVVLGSILSVTDESYYSTPVQGNDGTYDGSTLNTLRATPSSGGSGNSGTQTPVSIGKEKVYAAISVSYTICSTS